MNNCENPKRNVSQQEEPDGSPLNNRTGGIRKFCALAHVEVTNLEVNLVN